MTNKNASKNARKAAMRATPPGQSGIKPLRVVLPDHVAARLRSDISQGIPLNDTIRAMQRELFNEPSTTGIGVNKFLGRMVKPSAWRKRDDSESNAVVKSTVKRPWSSHAERVLPEEYAIDEADFNVALEEAQRSGRTRFTAHSLLTVLAGRV
jgi:hypothetical protein